MSGSTRKEKQKMHCAYVVQPVVKDNPLPIFKIGYTSNLKQRMSALCNKDEYFKNAISDYVASYSNDSYFSDNNYSYSLNVLYVIETETEEEGLLAESALRMFYSMFTDRVLTKKGKPTTDHFEGVASKYVDPRPFVQQILLSAAHERANVEKEQINTYLSSVQDYISKSMETMKYLQSHISDLKM